jgi:two-component system sensor histidine kinase CpxA
MRSLFAKILLWSFGTLVVALVAFWVISVQVTTRAARRGSFFGRARAMQMEDARKAYETGGKQALAEYLERLETFFPGEHYFTDASGKDLVDGSDRSALLAQSGAPSRYWPSTENTLVMTQGAADGHYHFIIVVQRQTVLWDFVPYYLLILIFVALFCYILAIYLARPLRTLRSAVQQFGRGELSARVNSGRQDEIGELSRAFDQMAERIETLLTAERRLLQDISHELRSPLARLSFAVELTRTASDREAAVARIRKEVDRLSSLVGGLLQVTRVEGDPASRNVEELSLDQLLRELAGDCAIEAQSRKCDVLLDAPVPVALRGDRELLRRAIENVLRNAIRYSPEGSGIEMKLEAREKSAMITIRDYGPGVPEELLNEIFKPFVRVGRARDTASGGVGLGLAIAYRAVTLHHGVLEAVNVNPGLKVTVELPLDAPPPVVEAPAPVEAQVP